MIYTNRSWSTIGIYFKNRIRYFFFNFKSTNSNFLHLLFGQFISTVNIYFISFNSYCNLFLSNKVLLYLCDFIELCVSIFLSSSKFFVNNCFSLNSSGNISVDSPDSKYFGDNPAWPFPRLFYFLFIISDSRVWISLRVILTC